MRAKTTSRVCLLDSLGAVVKPTSMLRALCIIPFILQACVLEPETCGESFTAVEGRCVAIQLQSNTQDGGGGDVSAFAMDTTHP